MWPIQIQEWTRWSARFTYVLLGERVDQLGEDLVGDNSLGQLIRVVGQTAEGQGSRLLDGRHVIEQKGSQESHNA